MNFGLDLSSMNKPVIMAVVAVVALAIGVWFLKDMIWKPISGSAVSGEQHVRFQQDSGSGGGGGGGGQAPSGHEGYAEEGHPGQMEMQRHMEDGGYEGQ